MLREQGVGLGLSRDGPYGWERSIQLVKVALNWLQLLSDDLFLRQRVPYGMLCSCRKCNWCGDWADDRLLPDIFRALRPARNSNKVSASY